MKLYFIILFFLLGNKGLNSFRLSWIPSLFLSSLHFFFLFFFVFLFFFLVGAGGGGGGRGGGDGVVLEVNGETERIPFISPFR